MKRFLAYLYRKKRRVFYFLVIMVVINFVAANQKYYALNLLSVFIMVFWSVILISDMQTDDNGNEK
ncbi:hypothetical protein CS238_05505 [Salmonella enterica]|nr:hypothetical protein [Salmonella enterica]